MLRNAGRFKRCGAVAISLIKTAICDISYKDNNKGYCKIRKNKDIQTIRNQQSEFKVLGVSNGKRT